MAAEVFAATPAFNDIEIQGELSGGKRYPSGHFYFTLKDENAAISGVMFRSAFSRLNFIPENGDKVVLRGNISLYEQSGRYQVIANSMQPMGLGNLYLEYERLKKDLERQGYFSPERKKSIPVMPKIIGLATSEAGAVLHDIITVLRRRFPGFKLDFIPVPVQGQGAAERIAEAIDQFNLQGRVDVIIIGRGGGSIEDLWAFNEKELADAIYRSNIPIISAVGHETDFTIADFTADLRAATPSAAAELVIVEKSKLYDLLEQNREQLRKALQDKLDSARKGLEFYSKRPVLSLPDKLLQGYRQQLDELMNRLLREINFHVSYQKQENFNLESKLNVALRGKLDGARQKQLSLEARLKGLDPLAILDRGYSYVQSQEGTLIKSVDQAQSGAEVHLYWRDGSAKAKIEEIRKGKIDVE